MRFKNCCLSAITYRYGLLILLFYSYSIVLSGIKAIGVQQNYIHTSFPISFHHLYPYINSPELC